MRRFEKALSFIVSALIISFSCLAFLENSKAWGMDYTDYWIIVDEHDRQLPIEGWYYNCTGGDRGVMNDEVYGGDIAYGWDEDSNLYSHGQESAGFMDVGRYVV